MWYCHNAYLRTWRLRIAPYHAHILYLLFLTVASNEAQISLECYSLEAVPCSDIQHMSYYCGETGVKT